MEIPKRSIDRAYELAKSGEYSNPTDVLRQLRAEGYNHHQIEGIALLRQLSAMINHAKLPRS